MNALDVVKREGLLSWHTLIYGLSHKWCEKQHLVAYADDHLLNAVDDVDLDLLQISSGLEMKDGDLIQIGLHFLEAHGQPMSDEKKEESKEIWRFAKLRSLLEASISSEEKLTQLQELYAEFGFPDDMSSCSIYAGDAVDPLLAAQHVADRLAHRFNLAIKP